MDNSETQARIINLGKAIVAELESEERPDTLSRWMAHYIAEKIVAIEHATGDKKIQAEKACFETILSLWDHRASLPDGHRPFQSFDAIFYALDRLNPDNPRPFYISSQHSAENGVESDDVKKLLDIALAVDANAKILIDFIIREAAKIASDEKTINWLKNAIDSIQAKDVSIIIRLISDINTTPGIENTDDVKDQHNKSLRSKIDTLDKFSTISKLIREGMINNMKD
jgi:hypothetical protein